MEDRLERVLNRVIDWLKYEEAKNGALIAVNGVFVGALLTWTTPSTKLVSFCLECSLVLLLLSLLIALYSFYPSVKSDQLKRLAPALRRLWWTWLKERLGRSQPETKNRSLLFFVDIAGLDAEVYLEQLRASVHEKAGTPLESDYAHQIVACSNIALLKLRIFEAAFFLGFLAFTVALVAVIGRGVTKRPQDLTSRLSHHEQYPTLVPTANPADAPAINVIANGDFSEKSQKLNLNLNGDPCMALRGSPVKAACDQFRFSTAIGLIKSSIRSDLTGGAPFY